MYHMVTGNVPFDGKNPSAVMHKHLKAELVAPDHVNPKLSAGISEVIEMMMTKDAGGRYQNCKDLLTDLRAIREGKFPPMAHKGGISAVTLAQIAEAEASALHGGLAVDQSRLSGKPAKDGVIIALIVMLILSVVVNIVQLALRGS